LVSYNDKHNQANGENNSDGESNNQSWNSGWEGETDDPYVEALREQQIRNFLTILLVSQGTPMIVMGDEVRRTQHGNNNTYGQDNELGWFNWDGVEHDDLRHARADPLFVSTRFSGQFWSSLDEDHQMAITWRGTQPHQPNWAAVRTPAFSLSHQRRRLPACDAQRLLAAGVRAAAAEARALDRIVDTHRRRRTTTATRGKHQVINGRVLGRRSRGGDPAGAWEVGLTFFEAVRNSCLSQLM
jgi:pullulanase/glycogen debranching enzyme